MKKHLHFFLIICTVLLCISCEKEDKETTPKSSYISINNDTRNISENNSDGYEIELSNYLFDGNSSEPDGIQFVMEIWDSNLKYIKGIGGFQNCKAVQVYIDVFKTDFSSSAIKTIFNASSLTKIEKQNKSEVFIRLRNFDGDVIIAGTAVENQSVNVIYENGKYFVEFSNLNFISTDGDRTFTASGKIITDKSY